MTTDELTTERTASSTDWAEALHNYETAEADYERISAEHDARLAAYYAERGEPNPDFETYGLGRFGTRADNRERRIRQVEAAIAVKDYAGQHLSADDFAAIAKKAAQLVDESEAYFAKSNEVHERTVGPLEELWEAALDKLYAARDVLLAFPAPDVAALTFKIELLTRIMTEADVDDAERMQAIRDDARRLLGRA